MAPEKQSQAKKVYDYSGLKEGMRVQVESDGTYYAADVVAVSTSKSRAKAPVKVSFKGYDGFDEWVGGDRLRSKALKVQATEKKVQEKKDEGSKRPLIRLGKPVPAEYQVLCAVIGGSGLYEMPSFTDQVEVGVQTPFGRPSDNYVLGKLDGVPVAFLSRHGRGHLKNPSEVNYRANIFGLKRLGVKWVVAVTACGSLKMEIVPGHMVLIDQFIDRTVQRPATFFCGGVVAHVPFANPICHVVQKALREACEELGVEHHVGGTYVNMEGPAFSTKAESEMHRSWGASVIGMTNMTEARLAREAEMSLATIAMSTDYDAWHPSHESVTVEQVMKTAGENVDKAKNVILKALPKLAAYKGDAPAAQTALGGGGAIMTAKDKIPAKLKRDLEPILGAYL